MPDNKDVSYDHNAVDDILRRARSSYGDVDEAPEAGDGVDPEVAEAMRGRGKSARDAAQKGLDDLDIADTVNQQIRQESDNAATRAATIEPATTTSSGSSGGSNAASLQAMQQAAAQQSQAMQQAAMQQQQGMAMAMQQQAMQQAAMQQAATRAMTQPVVNYANYTPTPATATQYDMANAPNRKELSDAIYEAIKSGNYGTGEEGDDRPRKGGGTRGSFSGDADDEKALEVLDSFINAEPPIPYAWGGGHGADPGISQGISDGGGHADAMGDYAKQGLDCSGFARAATYEIYDVDIGPSTAADQYATGTPISEDEARPGDLFFPDSAGRPPSHVQVYAGDGYVAEAQQSGTDLMYSPIASGEWRRMVD